MRKPRNRRPIKYGILLASAILGCFCLALWTEETSAQSDASPAPSATNYVPSISDLMIATIHPVMSDCGSPPGAETGRLLPTNWGILRAPSIVSAVLTPWNTKSRCKT